MHMQPNPLKAAQPPFNPNDLPQLLFGEDLEEWISMMDNIVTSFGEQTTCPHILRRCFVQGDRPRDWYLTNPDEVHLFVTTDVGCWTRFKTLMRARFKPDLGVMQCSDAHEWASRGRVESSVVGEGGALASGVEWRRVVSRIVAQWQTSGVKGRVYSRTVEARSSVARRFRGKKNTREAECLGEDTRLVCITDAVWSRRLPTEAWRVLGSFRCQKTPFAELRVRRGYRN
jgi:hypothetical protein